MEKLWHSLSVNEVAESLNSISHGLRSPEVDSRLKKFGLNELSLKKGPTLWWIFGRQFLNPLVYILLLATIVKFFPREYT